MHVSRTLLLALLVPAAAHAAPPACRRATWTAEVQAGAPFQHALGDGLNILLVPIHSGWILRVEPAAGPLPPHDYAELATPPYNSVTPLSISTDFAFRAQDAVGWNPRHFRFASSRAAFAELEQTYAAFMAAGPQPPLALQSRLAGQVARTAEGTLTILDARLVPGSADQWQAAAAVASHFSATAHTLDLPAEGQATPLGRLVWLRFRLDLDLPPGFRPDASLPTVPRPCAQP